MTRAFLADTGTAAPRRQQHGALCWRRKGGELQILLITSRDTGRWVLPKGWPHRGLAPAESAAAEAWEEAGVRGRAAPVPVGRFLYLKRLDSGPPAPCMVEVHAIEVETLEKRYPERRQRQRKWFTPPEAAARVAEPGLQALLAGFVPPVEAAS